ncbi:MAG: sulfatase-like hydrolase/transferase [Helicobacteraceae bacterium]|nr:sulfatase-like hydrolase/transferase [Helicobacteraceae bacterium]
MRGLLSLLKPFAFFCLIFFALFAGLRVAFAVFYAPEAINVNDLCTALLIGARMDSIVICALSLPVVVWTIASNCKPQIVSRLYFAFCAFLLTFFEVISAGFLDQYGLRPNHLFFDYLDHPKEIFYMLIFGYPILTLIGILLTILAAFTGYKIGSIKARAAPLKIRLIATPIAIVVLSIGARSSFGISAANLGVTMFGASQTLNEIASNGTYSALYSLYQLDKEVDLSEYGAMDDEEILARTGFGARTFSGTTPSDPPNIVIVIWESMGAEFIGALGGLPLTPNFDNLAKEGTLLTNMYATGTRTSRGIEAILAGFLPIVGAPVVKLPKSQNDFWTIANHLKPLGYNCEFLYGGDANFDNMSRFLGGNGFAIRSYFARGEGYDGRWGSDDLAVFMAANREFAKADAPFCAVILTLSSHLPFDYPNGVVAPYNSPAATRENAALFADYALGEFFKAAKREPYYQNSIFLIVADHTIQVRGGDPFAPLEKYRIPALFLGRGVSAAKNETIASQVDLPPTLIALIGDDRPRPPIGRDLFAASDEKGEAVMQAGSAFAYLAGDTITILRRGGFETQARVDENGSYSLRRDFALGEDGEYIGALEDANATEGRTIDDELARDALARLLLSNLLYQKRLHSARIVQ